MTTVIKLGGSIITEKETPETIDRGVLDRATELVSNVEGPLALVHGAGSFGHHHAAEYGISTTVGTSDDAGVRAIHGAMKRLNDAVLKSLAESGVRAVPVHPFSTANRESNGRLRMAIDPVSTMLSEGFVPVLHGDVVAHEGKGVTILSGDEIIARLSTALEAHRVGVCSSVPGVYDTDGEVIDRIESMEDVAAAVGESDTTDVTGGMAGKVRELLALDAPAYIFDIDGLDAFVAGRDPGTRIG